MGGTLRGNTFLMQTARPVFTPYLHTMATLYQLPTGVTWRTTAVFLASASDACLLEAGNEFRYSVAPTPHLGFGPFTAPAFQGPRGVYVARGNPRIVNASNLVAFGAVTVPGAPITPFFDDQRSCAVEDAFTNGIQNRPAGSPPPRRAQLGIPVPNPADASVSFTYELPEGVASGELVLRESVNGRVVLRREVRSTESVVSLSVAVLPQGLYLAMLTANGRPLTSVRLQIVR